MHALWAWLVRSNKPNRSTRARLYQELNLPPNSALPSKKETNMTDQKGFFAKILSNLIEARSIQVTRHPAYTRMTRQLETEGTNTIDR
jgi:hypothetical protein